LGGDAVMAASNTPPKPTAAYWKRQAEKAEARYQWLRREVQSERARDRSIIVELADTRHFKTQARALLVEAIVLLDSIVDADEEAELRREEANE
jgi:hypothetical protein